MFFRVGEDEVYKPYEELEDQMHEKAKDFAGMLLYVANCIQYYLRVGSCNDCNTCGKNPECEYLPRLGETTRINCPLWEEKSDDKH